VSTISRLLKFIGLFCRILSVLQGHLAKETYIFKEPTNRSHPIRTRRAAFPQSSGHGWSGEGLQTPGLTSIHRICVFCICRIQSISVGISGDNPSLEIHARNKTYALLPRTCCKSSSTRADWEREERERQETGGLPSQSFNVPLHLCWMLTPVSANGQVYRTTTTQKHSRLYGSSPCGQVRNANKTSCRHHACSTTSFQRYKSC